MTVHINVLSLTMDLLGPANVVHPVLIWDENEATLIDAGFPGQFEQLRLAVQQAGVNLYSLRRVIITHQDWDHIGTIPEIIAACNSKIDILAHAAEKPYLEGATPYIKMNPARISARLSALPERLRPAAAGLFARIPTFCVNKTLEDGELLPFHGGLKVIHTPGHTPGHICLYLQTKQILISGDELRVVEGKLAGPAHEHTPDMALALKALQKLDGFDIQEIICYHGGIYRAGNTTSVTNLLR